LMICRIGGKENRGERREGVGKTSRRTGPIRIGNCRDQGSSRLYVSRTSFRQGKKREDEKVSFFLRNAHFPHKGENRKRGQRGVGRKRSLNTVRGAFKGRVNNRLSFGVRKRKEKEGKRMQTIVNF